MTAAAAIAMRLCAFLWPLVKPFMGLIAAGAIGFAACEGYEHRVPWGLGPKLAAERVAATDPSTKKPWADTAKAEATELVIVRSNVTTCRSSLDRQNQAVSALAQASALHTAQAQAAVNEAHSATVAAAGAAKAILAAKPGADTCESALSLIQGATP